VRREKSKRGGHLFYHVILTLGDKERGVDWKKRRKKLSLLHLPGGKEKKGARPIVDRGEESWLKREKLKPPRKKIKQRK